MNTITKKKRARSEERIKWKIEALYEALYSLSPSFSAGVSQNGRGRAIVEGYPALCDSPCIESQGRNFLQALENMQTDLQNKIAAKMTQPQECVDKTGSIELECAPGRARPARDLNKYLRSELQEFVVQIEDWLRSKEPNPDKGYRTQLVGHLRDGLSVESNMLENDYGEDVTGKAVRVAAYAFMIQDVEAK